MKRSEFKKRYFSGRASKRLSNELMAEQTKLLDAQKNLKQLIGTINERLNALKVEELQLRSTAATTDFKLKPESKFDPSTSNIKSFDFETSTEVINKQNLNLEFSTEQIFKALEEEDDD